jgi:hypothetical protein
VTGAPVWWQVAVASLVVLIACTAGACAFWYAVRHRNWLLHVVGAGCAVFVAGMVGERNAPPSGRPGSVWDLSIQLPGVPVRVDQLSVAGVILALLGLSLVLFFEHVVPSEQRWVPPPPRRLDEDDTV